MKTLVFIKVNCFKFYDTTEYPKWERYRLANAMITGTRTEKGLLFMNKNIKNNQMTEKSSLPSGSVTARADEGVARRPASLYETKLN